MKSTFYYFLFKNYGGYFFTRRERGVIFFWLRPFCLMTSIPNFFSNARLWLECGNFFYYAIAANEDLPSNKTYVRFTPYNKIHLLKVISLTFIFWSTLEPTYITAQNLGRRMGRNWTMLKLTFDSYALKLVKSKLSNKCITILFTRHAKKWEMDPENVKTA